MEVYVVGVPAIDALKKYYPTNTATHPGSPDAVVRLWTDDETCGLGQQEIQGTDTSFLRQQFQRIVGRDPLDLDPEAFAPALMRALYDLQGKALGWPVYRLLGKKVRDQVPVAYWTANEASPEDTAAEAIVAVKKGFKTYKWHTSRKSDTVARVKAIHEAVGDKLELRIDRGAGWSFSETIRIAKELSNYNIQVFEDPLEPAYDLYHTIELGGKHYSIPIGASMGVRHDPERYRLLRKKIDIPIAWHTGSIEEIFLAAKTDAIDYLCTGGYPSKLHAISAITEAAGIPMWLQTIGVGGGGIAGAFEAHVGAVVKNAILPADNLHFLREDDLVEPHLEPKGGYIEVPEKPGIGVELNMEAVRKYLISYG
jgi:L-alanine-DL-glutamate epimerase-like enolase superfamily enzyme